MEPLKTSPWAPENTDLSPAGADAMKERQAVTAGGKYSKHTLVAYVTRNHYKRKKVK